MKLNSPPVERPRSPLLVGFDMPGAQAMPGAAVNQVLSATLDSVPSAIWLDTLQSLVERFKADNNVEDVRVVGRTLNVIGPRRELRTLTDAVKRLVETVADQVVRNRVNSRAPVAAAPVAPLSRWVDEELLSAVPRVKDILQWLHDASTMRFTAVARVTDWSWTALAFHDSLGFGMLPMQQLVLEDTICNEIRQHRQSVIFGHASADAVYSRHRVPGLYGFESYLSIPIITPEGAFFGTLCALDREPKVFSADFVLQVESEARWIGTQVGGLLGKPDQR